MDNYGNKRNFSVIGSQKHYPLSGKSTFANQLPTPEEYIVLLAAYKILNKYAENFHVGSWEELSSNSAVAAEEIRKSFYYIQRYFERENIEYATSFDVIKTAVDAKLGSKNIVLVIDHPYPDYETSAKLQDYYAKFGYKYFNIFNLPYGKIKIVMNK